MSPYPGPALSEIWPAVRSSPAPMAGSRVDGLVPDTTATLHARLNGLTSGTVTIQVGPGMERTGVVLQMQ